MLLRYLSGRRDFLPFPRTSTEYNNFHRFCKSYQGALCQAGQQVQRSSCHIPGALIPAAFRCMGRCMLLRGHDHVNIHSTVQPCTTRSLARKSCWPNMLRCEMFSGRGCYAA
eukprot:954944-Pelagomonas_calceolata.AAC.3